MGYVKKAQRYYASGQRKYQRANAWSKTPQTPRALALQAYKGVKYLKGLVNSEMLHNQGSNTLSVSSTGSIVSLSAIAQGDTSSGRTGNSILSKNLLFRVAIANNAASTNTFYRMMIVWDKQQIGDTIPAISDILETVNYLSPLATASQGRFDILFTSTFSTNSVNNTNKIIQKYYKFYKHIRYNGSASSDIQKNGLYLVLLSDQAVNTPTVYYQFKLGYHDN